MALFIREDKKTSVYGRVYIFELDIDGEIVHKVGMVNSDSMGRVTDRLMEVLRSYFMVYRVVPRSRIVKAVKVRVPYYVETYAHSLLEGLEYHFDKKFDGCNEFFQGLDEVELGQYLEKFDYRELLSGKQKMDKERYEKISEAIREQLDGKNDDKVPF